MATVINEKEKRARQKRFFLLKKLLKTFFLLVLIGAVCYFLIFFTINNNKKSREEIKNLRKLETTTISKARELDRKALLTKGYIEIWDKKLPAKMKIADGIEVESIRKILSEIADKHYITNMNVNFSMPTSVFSPGKTVSKITNSEITITFNCLNEYSVYYFLKDLKEKNEFSIYIIESLEMKKVSNFDKTFIKALLNNEMRALFKTTIKLQWYELSAEEEK